MTHRLYLTDTRYYAVVVQNDLFGHATIVRYWGGRWSRQGGMVTEPYSAERLEEIERERLAHGYQRVSHPFDESGG